MKLRFYLISTVVFCVAFIIGLFTGRELGYNLMIYNFGNPEGEIFFTFFVVMAATSVIGGIIGLLISLIIIERLGRRWGPSLSFGSHPVLKITFLAFLTFLGLLFLLLLLYPSK